MSQVSIKAFNETISDDDAVVTGRLDRRPDATWNQLFRRIVEPAYYGLHPRLEHDTIVVRSRGASGVDARFAISQAVVAVNAILADQARRQPHRRIA